MSVLFLHGAEFAQPLFHGAQFRANGELSSSKSVAHASLPRLDGIDAPKFFIFALVPLSIPVVPAHSQVVWGYGRAARCLGAQRYFTGSFTTCIPSRLNRSHARVLATSLATRWAWA